MKDSFWFPIVFMLIMVIFFAGILAVMYRTSESKIQDYQIDTYQRTVLKTLAAKISEASGQSRTEILANYPMSYERYVQELFLDGFERRVFQAIVAGEVVAYCFEIKGNGLWGTMQALVSTSTDFRTILVFDIVDQKETPGLGARIQEEWFLQQFYNRLFVSNPESPTDVTQNYEFIAETQSPETDQQLRRITGATITSDSVLKMLKHELNYIYNNMRTKEL